MDLAVTSPAEPVNSENAMDGSTYILQLLVAATESNANIMNYLISNNKCVRNRHL